jgi:hypothetical protein
MRQKCRSISAWKVFVDVEKILGGENEVGVDWKNSRFTGKLNAV